MLSIEREPLESAIRSVRHDHFRFGASRIDPQPMRRVELAIGFAAFSKRRHVIRVFVELVNHVRSVSISDKKTAVRKKRKIGGEKVISAPDIFSIGKISPRIFIGRIGFRIHWRLVRPDFLAV